MTLDEKTEQEYNKFEDRQPRLAQAFQQMKKGFGEIIRDPRLYEGLAYDALGLLNYAAYLAGPEAGLFAEIVLDPVVGGLQVNRIQEMYGDDLNQLETRIFQAIGFIEEAFPLALDWIPTMTLTNLYVHKRDNIREVRQAYRDKKNLQYQQPLAPALV